MPSPPPKSQVLPILVELCDRLDQVFIEQIGPFGELIVGETRDAWIRAKPRIRATDVDEYVVMLARQIPDAGIRTSFVTAARDIIGNF